MKKILQTQHAEKDPDFFAAIIFPPLMFVSGFVSYVLYHDYGAFSPEVLLGYVALISAGLVVGFLLAKAGPTNLRAFGIGLLLLVYVDVHLNFFRTVVGFVQVSEGQLFRYGVFLLGCFFAFLIILGLRKKLASIVAVIFGTLLITTAALPLEKMRFGSDDLPQTATSAAKHAPIIHLVLDGHIGIEGVPEEIAGGMELRTRLKELYTRWGFRVFGRAYSKYFMTYDSLSNMFNGVASETKAGLVSITKRYGKSGLVLKQNLYFQQVMQKGYLARVYQSDYLDFCQAAIDHLEHCYVYASASPQLIRNKDLPVGDKAELIVGSYINDSAVYNAMRVAYRLLSAGVARLDIATLPQWERKNYEFSSLGVPAVLQRLAADIARSPDGRVFFAHLLLPHGPYVWDKQCQLRADSDTWLSRRHEHENLLTRSSPDYRESAYRGYFEQAHCLVSLLDDLFASLDRQELLDKATVIVHGDHGSRITLADPVDPAISSANARDFVDSFSTLLAIRSPSTIPAYDGDMRSIQSLFAQYVLQGTALEEDGNVLLQTMGNALLPASMPQF